MSLSTTMDEGDHDNYVSYGWKKCKQQPLVPLGVLATCVALIGATRSLRSGNRAQFQKYLRLRVAAQGITVVAAVAGTLLLTDKSEQQKESRTRALTGQVPPDFPSTPITPIVRAPATTPPPVSDIQYATPDQVAATPSQRGKISLRALRQSQSVTQARTEEGPAGQPMRASDFTRRLGEAEKLQAEMDGTA